MGGPLIGTQLCSVRHVPCGRFLAAGAKFRTDDSGYLLLAPALLTTSSRSTSLYHQVIFFFSNAGLSRYGVLFHSRYTFDVTLICNEFVVCLLNLPVQKRLHTRYRVPGISE